MGGLQGEALHAVVDDSQCRGALDVDDVEDGLDDVLNLFGETVSHARRETKQVVCALLGQWQRSEGKGKGDPKKKCGGKQDREYRQRRRWSRCRQCWLGCG